MPNDSPPALARFLAGLTQVEVAAALGCTQSHVSQVERGVREPSPGFAARLARLLGVPVHELFPVVASPPTPSRVRLSVRAPVTTGSIT